MSALNFLQAFSYTIYDDPNDSLTVEFIPGPELEYDYWQGESFDFDALR